MYRFLIAIGLLMLGFIAKAEVKYMYWTVNQDNLREKTEFAYAQLAVLKDDVQLTAIDGEGDTVGVYMDLVGTGEVWTPETSDYPYGGAALVGGTVDDPVMGTKLNGSQVAVILDEWQGAAYSFQLELYNSEWEQVGPTQVAVSYEALVNAIFEKSGSAGADRTWNAIGPAPVPEPTGGVLFLLGVALLGLRRKKAVA